MLFFKEETSLPKDFAFDMFERSGEPQNDPCYLHYHDFLEINYVMDGTGRNIIENVSYKLIPGDIYIINNHERHYAFYDGKLRLMVIIFNADLIWQSDDFDYSYIRMFFDRNVNFSNCIRRECPISPQISAIILEMWDEWNGKQEGYKLVIKALLMKMLSILYRYFKSIAESEDCLKFHHSSYERIRDVIFYIHENYQKPISLEYLSSIALMNKNYLSTYFKRAMKININQYIQKLRVNHACMLLRSTQKSILDICLESGFTNVTYFNKVFKAHKGSAPNQYRSSNS